MPRDDADARVRFMLTNEAIKHLKGSKPHQGENRPKRIGVGRSSPGQVRCGVPAYPNGQHELYFPVGITCWLGYEPSTEQH